MQIWISLVITSALMLAPAGCTQARGDADEARPAVASAVTPTASAHPLAGVSQADRGAHLRGRVAERLDAGSYTYLDLALDDGGRRWVVVMGAPAADRGDEIEVVAMGTRQDFHSRRLDRTFAELTFASLRR
ncbi:hypothetical protein [Haliangium sp.]|uniref:hypothetical protein n=1 Tax=Haliangium sp. TaxID=2663208 RepID=UPI003D0A4B46